MVYLKLRKMFLRQTLKKSTKTYIFRLFNTFGPGEDLKNTQKGMVGIYSYYLWQNKPIIIKGSPNRFRNFVYIDDCINILFNSLNNKYLNNFEIINLTSAKKVTVKKLIEIMLKVNKKTNYKLLIKDTPSSFGLPSKFYLKKI